MQGAALLKCFFDLSPPDALAGKVAIPIATGGSGAHALVIDYALRLLLASVGARVVSAGIYGMDAQFTNGLDTALVAPSTGPSPKPRRFLHMAYADSRLGIYYEHPDWYRPLFDELDRRGVTYDALHADNHRFDPGLTSSPYAVVFNRMSPSAHTRGRGDLIFYTSQYLAHLERLGVRVINGVDAWRTEISKAYQLSLLEDLELPYPRARVIHRASQASGAAQGLRFPVVVKPNIGGSGAGIIRFDTPEALERRAREGLDLGIDHTALVQEYITPADGRIVRVEVLDGKFLYAIRIYTTGDTFNLCPADVCQDVSGSELARPACPVDAPKNNLRVEPYTPPEEIVSAVERIVTASGIEIGGVEYMIDARDGRAVFYDINALSNFVADAPRVIGFDPFVRLADWLIDELDRARKNAPVTARGAAAAETTGALS